MKDTTKKALAIGAAVILAGAAGAIGGALLSPVEKVTVEYQTKEIVKTIEVPVEVIKEVPVEKIVTVEKLVDNGDLALVTQRLEDLGVFEDAAEVVEEIKAEDAALALAVAEIKDKFADVLEDEGIVDDEDEVSLVTIKSSYEDVEVVDSDFDNDEYTFKIDVKVDDEDAETKVKTVFTVEVEDGEASIVDVEKV
jgi:hypothetical protein